MKTLWCVMVSLALVFGGIIQFRQQQLIRENTKLIRINLILITTNTQLIATQQEATEKRLMLGKE